MRTASALTSMQLANDDANERTCELEGGLCPHLTRTYMNSLLTKLQVFQSHAELIAVATLSLNLSESVHVNKRDSLA